MLESVTAILSRSSKYQKPVTTLVIVVLVVRGLFGQSLIPYVAESNLQYEKATSKTGKASLKPRQETVDIRRDPLFDPMFESSNDTRQLFSRSDGLRNNIYPKWSNYKIDKSIRKWGCNLKATPFIFVHIGKAGGGQVRARFAAAAQGYDRGDDWHAPKNDNHFYPVSSSQNASFCNSQYSNWKQSNSVVWDKSFEGNLECTAATPIGLAMACPLATRTRCLGCELLRGDECLSVYVSHNNLGNELHWLPYAYMQKWWNSTPWKDAFPVPWGNLDPAAGLWCHAGRKNISRPAVPYNFRNNFGKCSPPLAEKWDGAFEEYWAHASVSKSWDDHAYVPQIYSPIYSSMPILRATVVRDPWSWLISRFFWMGRYRQYGLNHKRLTCDDLDSASVPMPTPSWIYSDALSYIAYICGTDCAMRVDKQQISLEELLIQTEENLRNSFAVVGILEDIDTFYNMVSARVAYIDMSLNPLITGKRHQSPHYPESKRCKAVFSNETFQETAKKRIPILGVLDYLYKVAVEVSQSQLEELKQCSGPMGKLSRPTRRWKVEAGPP